MRLLTVRTQWSKNTVHNGMDFETDIKKFVSLLATLFLFTTKYEIEVQRIRPIITV